MKHIPRVKITLFLRQLATCLASGIPISESLKILKTSTDHPQLTIIITRLYNELATGKLLSQTLEQYKSVFGLFSIYLIRVGEQTGTLDHTLHELATHHEKQLKLSQQIRHLLLYPIITIVCAISMLTGMLIFVIPEFSALFTDIQHQLPLITRIIFYLSQLLNQHTSLCLLAPVTILIAITLILRSAHHQKRLLALTLRLPFIRYVNRIITLTYFARHLGLCFKAGASILDSLQLLTQPNRQPDFAYVLYQIRSKLQSGSPLHVAMQSQPYFPPMMIQMIKTGEETGNIDYMLDKIADFYESDIDHLIGQMTQLVEPLIMIILGVLIGGLVIGMYLPIFKLGSTL